MKQRLGIAQVMLNHPQLVVLDEPTAGLDPKDRVRFRHIIEDIGKESIVLLSTHIVSDIEKAADSFGNHSAAMRVMAIILIFFRWHQSYGD